jgi:hypothetical protein
MAKIWPSSTPPRTSNCSLRRAHLVKLRSLRRPQPAAHSRQARSPSPPRCPPSALTRCSERSRASGESCAPPPPSLGSHGFAGETSGGGDAGEGGGGALDATAARVPPVSPEEGDAGAGWVSFLLLHNFIGRNGIDCSDAWNHGTDDALNEACMHRLTHN